MAPEAHPAGSPRADPIGGAARGLPAQIAAQIGRRIIHGELKPGDRLPKEVDMLAQLQVSRTTLREALTMLASKGLVEAKQRVGTRVRAVEHWNMLDPAVMAWQGDSDEQALAQELFEMRLAVEPLAANLAARRASEDDVRDIFAALGLMGKEHENPDQAIEADISFHLCIIKAAHNRFLLPISPVIRAALALSVPRTWKTFNGLKHSLAMHARIAECIAERRPDEAAEACRRLLQDTYRRNFA